MESGWWAYSYAFYYFLNPHPRTLFSLLLEREKKGEKERNIDVTEKHQLVSFSYAPRAGIEPATWVFCLRDDTPTTDQGFHIIFEILPSSLYV